MNKMDKFRDPIHGYIYANEYEKQIIDTYAFQRLRNIRQLAMTHMVYHGAEHTRFGHSLGVMHVVSKAFKSAMANGQYNVSEAKMAWMEQILRFIALTHDLGHAPFSHAAEKVFPHNMEHEDYTRKIITETDIGEIIEDAGRNFQSKYGEEYKISPQLICDIYAGRNPGENNEFIFLKSFMDSELDCDKMDYLLRDSLYCGVNYGKYDMERLISCLTVFKQDEQFPRLAIKRGGIQAFEEFVLARYFMFVEVYFHRTRRYFDYQYAAALSQILPQGMFPEEVKEYLEWDDGKVWGLMKSNRDKIEQCGNIIYRRVYPMVLESNTHPETGDKQMFNLMKNLLYDRIVKSYFIEDLSADKMPHKIPTKVEITHEKAIVIIDSAGGRQTTISDESKIISNLTDKIDIKRLYVHPEKYNDAMRIVREMHQDAAG